MSILIQGPKQPGIDIHLYLALLKEELARLWETPVRTWDAYTGDYFYMRVALLTTVQDYPGCAYVSYFSVKETAHSFFNCLGFLILWRTASGVRHRILLFCGSCPGRCATEM